MLTPNRLIEEILLDAVSWNRSLDNQIVACVWEHTTDKSKSYIVPDEDLAVCHPLFPASLRGLLAWFEDEDNDGFASGNAVLATLECLQYTPVYVQGHFSEGFIFSAIGTIELRPHFPEYVWISGRRVFMSSADESLNFAPFVTKTEADAVRVEKNYLDRHYPGWQERWEMGLALGIGRDELMAHVFDKNPKPLIPPLTTDLTFD